MRFQRVAVSATFLLAALSVAIPADAETIVLSSGQTINAEVLREYPEHIVVDLGYDVLTIPRKSVVSIEKDESEHARPSDVTRTEHLFSTAQLPPQNVKNLVERFGEGVVLVSSPSGLGSGFFITKDGHLITNFHVIENETKIAVTVFRKTGQEFKREKIEDVEIVAINPFLDLALLKATPPEGYEPVVTYLDASDEVRDGDTVFAIGNPLGLERSVSQGIVSRNNRAEEGRAYIQTTTQINPGNSGGPLFNVRGEVIGVTNMKILGGEGLGFAIPVRYVIDFLKNRDAFAYNSASSIAGFRYPQPPSRQETGDPPMLQKD